MSEDLMKELFQEVRWIKEILNEEFQNLKERLDKFMFEFESWKKTLR